MKLNKCRVLSVHNLWKKEITSRSAKQMFYTTRNTTSLSLRASEQVIDLWWVHSISAELSLKLMHGVWQQNIWPETSLHSHFLIKYIIFCHVKPIFWIAWEKCPSLYIASSDRLRSPWPAKAYSDVLFVFSPKLLHIYLYKSCPTETVTEVAKRSIEA